MRHVRVVAFVATALVAGALAQTSGAVTATVPCTGNPTVDGTALQTLFGNGSTSDSYVLTAPCTYALSQTLQVAAGRTVVLSTTGSGHAALTSNGSGPLLRVDAGGRLDGSSIDLISGNDQQSGQIGLAGNANVLGTLDLTDSTLQSGVGDLAGNLYVAAGGHATLVRTSLVSGTAPATGATGAEVEGQLSLVDSVVSGIAGSTAPALRLQGSGASAEVFYDTVINDGSAPAIASGGALLRMTGTLIGGASPSCSVTSGTLQLVGSNIAHDACGSATVADPGVHRLLVVNGVYAAPPDPGSPAVDAGDAACGNTTSAQGYYAGPSDVRGQPRTFGSACDLGSYESHAQVQYDPPQAFTPGLTHQTLVLHNTGTDAAAIDPHPSITGTTAFSVTGTSCGTTLAAGTSCTVDVTYTPAATPQQGYLSFPDNAAGNGRVLLTGQAIAPPKPTPKPTPKPSPNPSPKPSPSPAPTRHLASPQPVLSPTTAPTHQQLPPARRTASPPPRVSPTAAPSPAAPSPSPSPALAVPLPDRRQLSPWQQRHEDGAMPWFVRNVPTPTEVDTSPGKLGRNLLLALVLLALLNLPVNLVNKALDQHGDTLAGWLAGLRRRLPSGAWLQRLPAPVRLGGAVLVTSAISSLLDPSVGLDREAAVTFGGLVLATTVLSTVATSVDDTWCERRLRVRARLELFPGFWALAAACVLVSRVVGLHPGLVLGSVAGLAAARALTTREDGTRVLVVDVALLALGTYAWVAYGPLAHDAERTHALHTEVLAAATGTVFVGGDGRHAAHPRPPRRSRRRRPAPLVHAGLGSGDVRGPVRVRRGPAARRRLGPAAPAPGVPGGPARGLPRRLRRVPRLLAVVRPVTARGTAPSGRRPRRGGVTGPAAPRRPGTPRGPLRPAARGPGPRSDRRRS